MKKEYWFVLITYIGMHLSTYIAAPLILFFGTLMGKNENDMRIIAATSWIVISFILALIIILVLLRKEMTNKVQLPGTASYGSSLGWAAGGVFLAMAAQIIAANIERLLGIELGSENTENIMMLIEAAPIVILISSIIGPILEEIVFRKVIFGSLHKRFNFFLSALMSSLIFAVAHMDFEHTLMYTAMGFTFAFLYAKTKRILVPIFAHVAMNTLVVIIQFNQERIENYLEKLQQMQAFIGGLL